MELRKICVDGTRDDGPDYSFSPRGYQYFVNHDPWLCSLDAVQERIREWEGRRNSNIIIRQIICPLLHTLRKNNHRKGWRHVEGGWSQYLNPLHSVAWAFPCSVLLLVVQLFRHLMTEWAGTQDRRGVTGGAWFHCSSLWHPTANIIAFTHRSTYTFRTSGLISNSLFPAPRAFEADHVSALTVCYCSGNCYIL